MMSPNFLPQPRVLAAHPQRPWRPAEPAPRHPRRSAIRTFAVPVVRELPPRQPLASPDTW
jgi:hypothetical protein